MKGKITELIGGIYTVETGGEFFECKARGIFRKQKISPVVGDNVEFEDGVIIKILERKNLLLRPPLANIDVMIFVISTTEPKPNFLVLDKLLVQCESENIEPVIVTTKNDISDDREIFEIYTKAGFKVFEIDYKNHETVERLREVIAGNVCAFTGNSGVGKSTLMNAIDENLQIPTSEISYKLGRGKHTTRHVQLYFEYGGLIADTPGFSSFDLTEYGKIKKDDLQNYFREFKKYLGKCRFNDCTHTGEPDCSIIEAVNAGEISTQRFEDYCTIYEELKKIKDWENK